MQKQQPYTTTQKLLLLKFHKKHGKLVTVTAVRPQARFGELDILDNSKVSNFKEKPQVKTGWINGGYFIIEPDFLNYIKDADTILEKEPLENLSKDGELNSYKHDGFWQCMDTKRDRDNLEEIFEMEVSDEYTSKIQTVQEAADIISIIVNADFES